MFDHTQRAWSLLLPLPVILVLMGGTVIRLVKGLAVPNEPALPIWIGIVLLIVIMGLTMWVGVTSASLRVRVDDHNIEWHFGSGTLRRIEPIRSVSIMKVIRTDWTDGWGYLLGEPRTFYKVWGGDALEITFETGQRVKIGTDKPQELFAALSKARALTASQ